MGCHFLLQGIFPTQGSNPSLLHLQHWQALLCHLGKTTALTIWTFVSKMKSLLFNMPSRFVIAFLPRSNHLLISWLSSLSAVILEKTPAILYITLETHFPYLEKLGDGHIIIILPWNVDIERELEGKLNTSLCSVAVEFNAFHLSYFHTRKAAMLSTIPPTLSYFHTRPAWITPSIKVSFQV